MFTPEELKNVLALLSRVDIKGNEAVAVALLIQKVTKLLETTPESEETKE